MNKSHNNKAFTLIELLVAMGILVIVLVFSGTIFKISMNSQRLAIANSEIMQKLRAITTQLDMDFKGLNKDAEIFVVWNAEPLSDISIQDNDLDQYERFDRIMFFSSGDFYSYGQSPMIRGNTAMICYMLAKNGNIKPETQKRNERILSRSQFILTSQKNLSDNFEPDTFTENQWKQWRNQSEYIKTSTQQWKQIPWEEKMDALAVINDIGVNPDNIAESAKGSTIDVTDANSIHMLLCEGVGEFKIQGWSDSLQKWIPEVDPDGDGNLGDTNFFFDTSDPNRIPGVLYPYPPNGEVIINNITYPRELIDKEHFFSIPGLGRALKFTFTLYDSKGIIQQGITFTHIVYLDD